MYIIQLTSIYYLMQSDAPSEIQPSMQKPTIFQTGDNINSILETVKRE